MLKKLRSSFAKASTGSSTSSFTSAPTPISSAPTPTSPRSITKQLNRSRSLYKEGTKSYDEGNYKNSLKCLQGVVQIQELSLGKYHTETIHSYWQLGKAACKCTETLGKNKRHIVLRAFQRAARMAEVPFSDAEYSSMLQDMKDSYHEAFCQDITTSTSTTSSFSSDCQSVGSGISHWSDENTVRQVQTDPMKHLLIVFELERKGDNHVKKKNYRKASNAYGEALKLQDVLVGEDSLDGADIRSKLALCFINTGATQQARRALQMAYTCFVAQVGTEHPATLGVVARMKKTAISTSTKSIMSATSSVSSY